MKKRSLLAALMCCVFALALGAGLAGCGGGGAASDPVAQGKAAFSGTWDLAGMETDGEVTSSEDLELLRSLGMDVYLDLDENGVATLILFGEAMEGTWEPKTATTADFTLEDETVEMTIDGDTLSMEQDGSKLEFTKGDKRDPSELVSSGSGDGEDVIDDIDSVVIADDDTVKIEVTGVGVDFTGDPCYRLSIQNKSDKEIFVDTVYNSFTVDGQPVEGYLGESVEAGETVEANLWFDNDELGGTGADALVDVAGSIEVDDGDTYDTIAEYDFKM